MDLSPSFRPGAFLARIPENWLGGKVDTRPTEEEMRTLEELPWLEEWLDGLRRQRAELDAINYSTLISVCKEGK